MLIMGKTLQDRIKDLEMYNPEINYKDGYFILKLTFNEGWTIINQVPDVVANAQDAKVGGKHWFAATIDDTETLFNVVDETINVNKEMERKLLFYHRKVKELEELILSDIPYDKLTTLQFTYAKPKKTARAKTKNAQTESNSCDSNNVDSVDEESVVNNDESKTNESEIDKKVAEVLA